MDIDNQNSKRTNSSDENVSNKRNVFIDNSTDYSDPRNLRADLRNVNVNSNFVEYMGYPQEYIDLYKIERDKRDFYGFDGLFNITNLKVYEDSGEQLVKQRIQQVTNKNCIK